MCEGWGIASVRTALSITSSSGYTCGMHVTGAGPMLGPMRPTVSPLSVCIEGIKLCRIRAIHRSKNFQICVGGVI